MKTRLGASVLLFVLIAGVLAGVPVSFGASECGLTMTSGMDCCRVALMQNQTAEVADARLCCALNCAQEGATTPPTGVRIQKPTPAGFLSIPSVKRPTVALHGQTNPLPGPPEPSPPVYLRNLPLLI